MERVPLELFSEVLCDVFTVEFSDRRRVSVRDEFFSFCEDVLVSTERPEFENLLALFCVSTLPVF